MQQLKTFAKTFARSISDPSYYASVLKAPFSFSFKYLALFSVLVAAVGLVPVLYNLAQFDHSSLSDRVLEMYPQDLEMSLGEEGLAINQPLPYIIALPTDLDDAETYDYDGGDIPVNMAVFTTEDDVQEIGMDGLREYESVVVVTETNMYFFKDQSTGEVRVYPIPEVEGDGEVVINKDLVEQGIQKILDHPFVKNKVYLVVLGAVLLVGGLVGTLLGYMITILFFALVVWFAARMFLKLSTLTYGKSYQVIMHSLTLPVIVEQVLQVAGYPFFNGWIFLAGLVVWTLFVLNASKAAPAIHHAVSPTAAKKKK